MSLLQGRSTWRPSIGDSVAAVAGRSVFEACWRGLHGKKAFSPIPCACRRVGSDGVACESPGSCDEADELVDGDDEDAKHQVAHHLGRATEGAAAGLVL